MILCNESVSIPVNSGVPVHRPNKNVNKILLKYFLDSKKYI